MVSPMPPTLRVRAQQAAAEILERIGFQPKVAMMLGTGHNSIAGQLKNKHTVRPEDLPEGISFQSQAPLLAGELEGVPVIVSDAPNAGYEGTSAERQTYPVRVLRAMGPSCLILTAAAASLRRQLEPGTIAVIEDHINWSGIHPLHGPNDDLLGPRFPDMSDPYSTRLRTLAREVAQEVGVPMLPAVFAAVPGPSLPTYAEYRFLARGGAELIGMSLVPEVLTAVHAGFEILALVGVTQMVDFDRRVAVSIEAMLDAADLAAPRMAAVLAGVVRRIGAEDA
jgi:purine-nucleoside phosphorylase